VRAKVKATCQLKWHSEILLLDPNEDEEIANALDAHMQSFYEEEEPEFNPANKVGGACMQL
jgi:hypothetical protein